MRLVSPLLVIVLILLVPMMLGGCQKRKDSHGGAGHNGHHHEHEHAEGPHGGHMLELFAENSSSAGQQAKYQAEWLHDDEQGIVTVYLLEADGKTPVSSPPEEVTITVRAGTETNTYRLPVVEEVGGVPAEAAFSITEPALVTALEIVGEGEEPILRAQIGETPVSGKFEPHEHDDDHGHAH